MYIYMCVCVCVCVCVYIEYWIIIDFSWKQGGEIICQKVRKKNKLHSGSINWKRNPYI